VPSTDRTWPVLWVGASEDFETPPKSSYFLWPVHEFKVLVTEPRPSKAGLDPFERAVLGASIAGVRTGSETARVLGLHEDFATQVLTRLAGRDLIAINGAPTRKGQEVLGGDHPDIARPAVVYAYRDLYSSQLWPRVATRETRRECVVEYDERGHPTVRLGTDGDPRRKPAFVVHPSRNGSPGGAPDPAELQRAIAGNARTAARAGGRSRRNATRPGPVSLVEDRGASVYLVAHIVKTRRAEDRWVATDPFGLGTFRSFEQWVYARATELPQLGKWLGTVDLPTAADEPTSDPDDAEADLERCRALLELVEGGDNVARRHLVVTLRDAIATLLHEYWQRKPIASPETALTGSARVDRALIDRLARQAGLVPVLLERTRSPEQLAEAVDSGVGTPGTILAALLLSYPVDRASPIVCLADEFPDLFELLSFLEDGDDSLTPSRARPSPDRLRRTLDAAETMHRLLLVTEDATSTDDATTDIGG
jgi:hypothetical protein